MPEKIGERIVHLMNNPKRIRNICTSAHIHHGKCVAGDTRVLLADGGIKKIKEIFEETAEKGKLVEENEDYSVYSPEKPIKVFSLNQETGKIEVKPISHVWRLTGGRTIRIKLRNGFEIETTPEHKYLKDGEFIQLKAEDLRLGDRLVCARKLEINSNQNIKKEILERLANENFYVNLKKDFSILMKKKILDYGIKKLNKEVGISIKEKSFYHGIWQNRYNLKDLIKLVELFKLSWEEIYNQIEFIFYRRGKQRGHNSLKMFLPQDFKDFFYLAGLFLGDGSGTKFVAGKEELGEIFKEKAEKLGIKVKVRKWRKRTPEYPTNKTLVCMLKCLFDYPLKKKSLHIRISDFVFRSKNAYVANLLRGYFDCDGSVEMSRRAVTISSVSKGMIEDLSLLLLRFSCLPIKEKDQTISLSGLSALNFMKEIGFTLQSKRKKLSLLVKKISGSMVCDTIKIGDKVMLIKSLLGNKSTPDLAYIEVKSIEESFKELVYDLTVPERHNFVAEGMVIHNTAFTDNLLAASGKMAEKYAGDLEKGMMTWQHADEQERLLTVDAANVSMIHEFNKEEYLINLIDTPGHIDFSGNVTRAMRAIDGTIVLICASEGVMPQTETVIRQAMRERVKPILFINKFDRLIKELKLTPERMQERIIKIMGEFNHLIEKYAEPQYKEKWKVNINDGSISFGSARDNWGLSLPFMQKRGITFKDILKVYEEIGEEERKKWFWENAPLYEVILDAVIRHLPDPLEAQAYRISKIWPGDLESEFGQDLIKCNPKGKLAFVVTRVMIDPYFGKEIAAGRLFSGTIRVGDEVYLNLAKQKQRIQQVLFYNGIKPEQVGEVMAGNVLALGGIKSEAGETVTFEPETPFTELKHIFEPVITKSINIKKPADLPKLIEVLRKVAKEDPSIKIEINEETGENLISGMGELHLEIIENRIKTERGVEVVTSPPIVVYRETITSQSPEMEGKSPNKHNKFFIKVEPLEEEIRQAIKEGKLPEGRFKKKDERVINPLRELGWDAKTAGNVKAILGGNFFMDMTRGEVHIGEVIDMVIDMFEEVMKKGPLCWEPCFNIRVMLVDLLLHEDAIHRGPAQVYPAVREAIKGAMMQAKPLLFEPLQILRIEAPVDYTGTLTKLISSKRGQLMEMRTEEELVVVIAKLPVAELLGWASDLRSATEGRGNSSLVDQVFEKLPFELQEKVRKQIIERKGLSESQLGA